MICMNCGKEIPDTAKFCPECGHPAGQQAVSTTIVVNGVSIDLVELESRIRFLEDTHRNKRHQHGHGLPEERLHPAGHEDGQPHHEELDDREAGHRIRPDLHPLRNRRKEHSLPA